MYSYTTTLLIAQAIMVERKAQEERDKEPAQYSVQKADRTWLLRRVAALTGNLMVRSGKAMERYAQPAPRCKFEDNCV